MRQAARQTETESSTTILSLSCSLPLCPSLSLSFVVSKRDNSGGPSASIEQNSTTTRAGLATDWPQRRRAHIQWRSWWRAVMIIIILNQIKLVAQFVVLESEQFQICRPARPGRATGRIIIAIIIVSLSLCPSKPCRTPLFCVTKLNFFRESKRPILMKSNTHTHSDRHRNEHMNALLGEA